MQIVCLGLLLFSLTWAAPMVQPQTEKTKQDCVEEQRQEEKNKENIALHHSGKRRNQAPASKENIVQEKEDLVLLGTNKNNQISKSQNLFENRRARNEDYSISNKENAHKYQKMPIYPESTENNGSKDRDDVISKLYDQEYGAALTRKNMQHRMKPEAMMKLLGEENKETKPGSVLSKIPASANNAIALSKGTKNHQRNPQAPDNPVKSKSTHHIQHNTDYPKQFPKLKKIPSNFEGSGYSNLPEREDNDLSSFSGDGQPFNNIAGKGETIDPDLEGADVQTEFTSPGEAEMIHPEAGGLGYNDIPETAENSRSTIGTREETAQEANTAAVSLVDGSDSIMGSTNFKELPGKEGNRVDAGSQNAHQGKVEFHYPHGPSKGKRKEGSSDVTESTNYNEIPKHGKGSDRKGTEHSNRNQVTSSEKQRLPSKGKSPGQLVPSFGLDNEIKNEIDSHGGPNNEGTITTHHGKNHYVPDRKNNSTWGKGMPQRKGSRGYRRDHSNRRLRPPKKQDSSEPSDSGSSSESDGD
ncbi:matrix extracellular phosphoglycoprotein [Saccopteryx bilineata]|uniref:matrix extracellular phosphoglycoprotein n=1 Tax=Saccopteryx bilineata TaxID=59482 RepID=UPI00338E51D2